MQPDSPILRLAGCLPACLLACLLAGLPARPPVCLLACLPFCLLASNHIHAPIQIHLLQIRSFAQVQIRLSKVISLINSVHSTICLSVIHFEYKDDIVITVRRGVMNNELF